VKSPPRTVVVGGGVIGLCCALFLISRGRRVAVVERGGQDHDCCSLGNAGFISPSHIVPLSAPGIVGKALRWMGDSTSPFYVRPRLDPAFLAWGLRFWLSSRPDRARRAEPVLRDLAMRSRELFVALSNRTGDAFSMVEQGLLVLFRDPRALEDETAVAERVRALGMPATVLDARGVAALEPGLTLDVIGGVHYPLDAHILPERFHAVISRLVADQGGEFLWDSEVTGFRTEGSTVRALRTAAGEIEGQEVVVAAGSWTPRLLRPLGVRLPLEPGKGYSLTLDAPRELPRRSLILAEARVAVTPMRERLRVGGTMEMTGYDLGISPPRIRGILASLMRYLPAFRAEDFRSVRPWAGLRPCSPDGLPYIGRLAGFENLSVAAGHAMMGLSLAPVTGELTAQILADEAPSVDPAPLRPDRHA
jgi:D-amino-acid dehydrogenase